MKSTNHRSLWPIAIASFFGVAIIGIAVFIAWAVRQNMDLVREDYYAEEIRFQRQIDRQQRTQTLGAKANISYTAARQVVVVSLPRHATGHYAGWIHFYRPSDAALDKNVKLSLDAAGVQTVNVEAFQNGLWKVRVHWKVNGEEFYADESLVLKTKDS